MCRAWDARDPSGSGPPRTAARPDELVLSKLNLREVLREISANVSRVLESDGVGVHLPGPSTVRGDGRGSASTRSCTVCPSLTGLPLYVGSAILDCVFLSTAET